jgi:hypothetical protein
MDIGLNLTEENFDQFIIKAYHNNKFVSKSEYLENLDHIKYFRRILRKEYQIGEIDFGRIRLALNHLTILLNVFKPNMLVKILFYKCEPPLYPTLKTFLLHFNYMPSIIHNINGEDIIS